MFATVDLTCGCAPHDNQRARELASQRKTSRDERRRAQQRLKAFAAVYGGTGGGSGNTIGITQHPMQASVVPAVGGADVWRPVW